VSGKTKPTSQSFWQRSIAEQPEAVQYTYSFQQPVAVFYTKRHLCFTDDKLVPLDFFNQIVDMNDLNFRRK